MDKKVLFTLVVVLGLISTTESWWGRRRRRGGRWIRKAWKTVKRVGKKILPHVGTAVKLGIQYAKPAMGMLSLMGDDKLDKDVRDQAIRELKDLREKDFNEYCDSLMFAAYELSKDMSEVEITAKLMEMDLMLSAGKETAYLEDADENTKPDNENLEELLKSLEEEEEEEEEEEVQALSREEKLSGKSEELNV